MTTENQLETVTPLGGKHSCGQSPVVQRELEIYHTYKRKLLALMPVNTPEKAKEYRKVLLEYVPDVAPIFREMFPQD
jgi:hypothetical protein